MHEGEIDIDEFLVERLMTAQFPQFANLPIHAVQSTGTVNVIYRLGDHFCARFPLLKSWARDIEKEWDWLPKLAPHLSLHIPEPVAKGQPISEYPFPWAIYRWIEGHPYQDDLIQDERQAAADLAQFLIELRRVDPVGAPPLDVKHFAIWTQRRVRQWRRCKARSIGMRSHWLGATHLKQPLGMEHRFGYTQTCCDRTCL